MEVVKEVFDIVDQETMVILTDYSALQTLRMQIGIPAVIRWAKENPEQVFCALRIYNDALLGFVIDCKTIVSESDFIESS